MGLELPNLARCCIDGQAVDLWCRSKEISVHVVVKIVCDVDFDYLIDPALSVVGLIVNTDLDDVYTVFYQVSFLKNRSPSCGRAERYKG